MLLIVDSGSCPLLACACGLRCGVLVLCVCIFIFCPLLAFVSSETKYSVAVDVIFVAMFIADPQMNSYNEKSYMIVYGIVWPRLADCVLTHRRHCPSIDFVQTPLLCGAKQTDGMIEMQPIFIRYPIHKCVMSRCTMHFGR